MVDFNQVEAEIGADIYLSSRNDNCNVCCYWKIGWGRFMWAIPARYWDIKISIFDPTNSRSACKRSSPEKRRHFREKLTLRHILPLKRRLLGAACSWYRQLTRLESFAHNYMPGCQDIYFSFPSPAGGGVDMCNRVVEDLSKNSVQDVSNAGAAWSR